MGEKIYHIDIHVYKRHEGKNAVQKGAYFTGQNLKDEETDRRYSYAHKGEKDEIINDMTLPPGASDKWRDPQYFYNAMEKAETNVDGLKKAKARVMESTEFSLFTNLSKEQNMELGKKFAQDVTDKFGVGVMISYHQLGGHNPHAHISYSERPIVNDELSKTKNRDFQNYGHYDTMRKMWSDRANENFKALGIDSFVDHRSHKDRGLTHEPQARVNPKSVYEEEQGITKQTMEFNHKVEKFNTLVDYSDDLSKTRSVAKQDVYIEKNTREMDEPKSFDSRLDSEQKSKQDEVKYIAQNSEFGSDAYVNARTEAKNVMSAKEYEDTFKIDAAYDKDKGFNAEDEFSTQTDRAKEAMSANQYSMYHKSFKETDPELVEQNITKLSAAMGQDASEFFPQKVLDEVQQAKEQGREVDQSKFAIENKDQAKILFPNQDEEPEKTQQVDPATNLKNRKDLGFDDKLTQEERSRQQDLREIMADHHYKTDTYREARNELKNVVSAEKFEKYSGYSAAYRGKNDYNYEEKFSKNAEVAKHYMNGTQYSKFDSAIKQKDPAQYEWRMKSLSKDLGRDAKDFVPKEIDDAFKDAKKSGKKVDHNAIEPKGEAMKVQLPDQEARKRLLNPDKPMEKVDFNEFQKRKEHLQKERDLFIKQRELDSRNIGVKQSQYGSNQIKIEKLRENIPTVAILPGTRRKRQEDLQKIVELTEKNKELKADMKGYNKDMKDSYNSLKQVKKALNSNKKAYKHNIQNATKETVKWAVQGIFDKSKEVVQQTKVEFREKMAERASKFQKEYSRANDDLKKSTQTQAEKRLNAKEDAKDRLNERLNQGKLLDKQDSLMLKDRTSKETLKDVTKIQQDDRKQVKETKQEALEANKSRDAGTKGLSQGKEIKESRDYIREINIQNDRGEEQQQTQQRGQEL